MVEVKRLAHYFSVPKGEYLRMLYNGTSSGLKSSRWAADFSLPTVGSNLRVVERGTFMADQDIVEIFINFMLSEENRSFYEVDIINVSK